MQQRGKSEKEALERETLIENTVYLIMQFIPHFLYNTYVICLAQLRKTYFIYFFKNFFILFVFPALNNIIHRLGQPLQTKILAQSIRVNCHDPCECLVNRKIQHMGHKYNKKYHSLLYIYDQETCSMKKTAHSSN